jgi:hypothetical protein
MDGPARRSAPAAADPQSAGFLASGDLGALRRNLASWLPDSKP